MTTKLTPTVKALVDSLLASITNAITNAMTDALATPSAYWLLKDSLPALGAMGVQRGIDALAWDHAKFFQSEEEATKFGTAVRIVIDPTPGQEGTNWLAWRPEAGCYYDARLTVLQEYVVQEYAVQGLASRLSNKSKGGHARAAALSPAKRKAIAKKAAKARWGR